MEVKLINYPNNIIDVIYTACRTCYSSLEPQTIYDKAMLKDNDEKLKLIRKVLDSKHESTVEHISFTFLISGVSRSLTHQLVRHRICCYSQQSQRYVEFKENIEKLEFLFAHNRRTELIELLDKYFVDANENNLNGFYYALIEYLYQIRNGAKPEDARAILPNATKTNIVFSCNLRELIHICNLRLCKHAQLEIRNLFKLIKQEVISKENCEWLNKYLVPNCKNCTDFRDCKGIE